MNVAMIQGVYTPLLEPVLTQARDLYCVPGLAVAVTHGGDIMYEQSFGVMDLSSGTPVTPTSLFHVAAVTRTFVAVAVMQLVEAAQLSLDSPVTAHLPYFRMADANAGAITVRQLLSHTAGMPNAEHDRRASRDYDDGALERYVRSLVSEKLIAPPGQSFFESDIGFRVLGDVIAKVSGQSFEGYVQREILSPIGLTASTLKLHDAAPGTVATPHIFKDDVVRPSPVFPYYRAYAPSGTLLSSAREMALWAIASVHRGEVRGARFLEPSSYDTLWRAVAQTGRGDGSWAALGWFLREHRGSTVVEHEGSTLGFSAALSLIPESSIGVVVLSNYQYAPLRALVNACLDAALGLSPESILAP
jgi:CubicO group peptidase (beta-lactamase class C family)